MTYACGRQFVKYMDKFLPVLEMGLSHHRVCRTNRSPLHSFTPMPVNAEIDCFVGHVRHVNSLFWCRSGKFAQSVWEC